MMQVRIVRVGVAHRFMTMPVGMRLGHRSVMRVLMMFVVDVAVFVLQQFMDVFVRMPLGKMNPETDAHQDAGEQQPHCKRFAEESDRQNGADEGGEGIVGAGARAAEVAQGQDKHDKAHADAE